jgi:hypothetical protein
MRGYIEILVKDRDGRIVQYGRHEMRSLLNNFLKVLEGFLGAVGGASLGTGGVVKSATVTAPDGTSKTIYIEWYAASSSYYYGGGTAMGAMAPDNDDSYGIIVGDGLSPVALDQYVLTRKIFHGTGSGQLDYGAMSVEDIGLDISVSPPIYRLRLIRSFTNFSGAAININEVGILARNYWYDGTYGVRNDVKYLIARDVLPMTYTVPNGGVATVAVTLEVEVG